MKKAILFFAAAAFTAAGFTQNDIEFEEYTDLVEGTTSSEDFIIEASFVVKNVSSQAITFGARRIVVQQPDGSKNQICWGDQCYGFGIDESPEEHDITIPPQGEESTLHGNFFHSYVEGTSIIQYCVFERANPSNEYCHETRFEVTGVDAIDEVELVGELSPLSPNPVEGVSSFSYSLQGVNNNAEIEIYNMVGAKVKTVLLDSNAGVIFMNADDFNSGIYFYALKADGKVLTTKKFIVAK